MNEANIMCACGNTFEFPFYGIAQATCLNCGSSFHITKESGEQ